MERPKNVKMKQVIPFQTGDTVDESRTYYLQDGSNVYHYADHAGVVDINGAKFQAFFPGFLTPDGYLHTKEYRLQKLPIKGLLVRVK